MWRALKYCRTCVIALAAVGWPNVAFAEGAVSGKIAVMQSYKGHNGLLVQINTAPVNPDGCPSSSWYIFPDDSPRSAFVQGAMLTALHSGRPIWVMLSGCYENYPMIKHISLLP